MQQEEKAIATNRRARFDYSILETFEAGIELKGTEVKSLRGGKASLSDSFARPEDGEIFIYNVHIDPYAFGNRANPDPLRPRKLLLHKREIRRLIGEVTSKSSTLIPLKLYFKNGMVKVELALAKGKKVYDKRRSIRDREADRELRHHFTKR